MVDLFVAVLAFQGYHGYSPAVPLFGQIFPLFGDLNSAVHRRSGNSRKSELNQLLGGANLPASAVRTAVFAVFSPGAEEMGRGKPGRAVCFAPLVASPHILGMYGIERRR